MSTLTQERTTTTARNGRATPPDLDIPGVTRPMTYDEYLASPEENARYEILDGYKVYRVWGKDNVPNPTRRHQDIQGNIYEHCRAFQRASRAAKTWQAACDIKISEKPLRTRQPDVLLISRDRLALNPPDTDPAPLSPAPELVVEIVSPSDTPAVLAGKIADYCRVGVRECWVVRPRTGMVETVEVVRLFIDGTTETAAVYGTGEVVRSEAFPDLSVAVADIFA